MNRIAKEKEKLTNQNLEFEGSGNKEKELKEKSIYVKVSDDIIKRFFETSINKCRITPVDNEIEQAVIVIQSARQPVIYTGSGAILSGAFKEVKELSRILNAPVFSSISGKGVMVTEEDPQKILK